MAEMEAPPSPALEGPRIVPIQTVVWKISPLRDGGGRGGNKRPLILERPVDFFVGRGRWLVLMNPMGRGRSKTSIGLIRRRGEALLLFG